METVTVAERPDLTERAWERTRDVLPEYNNHGDVLNRYWGRLTEEQPEFQFHLVGVDDEILARARSIPVRWGGSIEDLPAGIDGAIASGFDESGANVLCALVIMVPRDLQGRGLSAVAVQAMLELTRRHGFTALIEPVEAELEGPLSACTDRALRGVATHRRTLLRPVDARPRATRRDRPEARAALAPDHRHRRRVGGVDADGLPRERRLLVPRRARHRDDRSRGRPGQLLGAERVDAACDLIVAPLRIGTSRRFAYMPGVALRLFCDNHSRRRGAFSPRVQDVRRVRARP